MGSSSVVNKNKYVIPAFIDYLDLISELDPSSFAENEELIKKCTEDLEELYKTYIKHFYSDMSTYYSAKDDDDIEYIIENLTIISRGNRNNRELRVNIAKIIDHFRLVQARELEFNEKVDAVIADSVSNYYMGITDAINSNLEQTKQDIENTIKKASFTDGKLAEIDGRLRNINIDIIAVLSIFSAVIISFFGGLGFIGQALTSINNANPKLILIVITVSGIVVFNIIYCLFWMIGRTVRIPIDFECKNESCHKCDDNCGTLRLLLKRHPVFVIVNIVLIIIIIITYIKLPGMFIQKTIIK